MDLDLDGLDRACRELNLSLTRTQLTLLIRYGNLLREWNTRINLVSRRDTGRILSYHVIDSLAIARLVPKGSRVCDVGTGAGLPGIPLAIARPDISTDLIESSGKKCLFLHAAIKALNLPTVAVVNARVESFPSPDCDLVLSRLTGPFRRVVGESRALIGTCGRMVLYKLPRPARESVAAGSVLKKHRLATLRSTDVVLPVTGITRRFVVLGPA